MHARLIPSDATGPGAAEAQVLSFVDRALAGVLAPLRGRYAAGLAALEAWALASHGRPFASLGEADQDELLRELERGVGEGFEPSSRAFFELVRLHAVQGMFADPRHGGNAGEVGWDLIGFPGRKLAYSVAEQRLEGAVEVVRDRR